MRDTTSTTTRITHPVALLIAGLVLASPLACTSDNPVADDSCSDDGGCPDTGTEDATDATEESTGESTETGESEVDESDESDESSETDGTEEDSSETDGTDEDSTEGGEPVCGNGLVEEGEACDDGNLVAGDGCSATCRPSGEILFDAIYDDQPCAGTRVAIAADDSIRLLGACEDDEERILAYDGSGQSLWEAPTIESPNAIAVADTGALAVGGSTTLGGVLLSPSGRITRHQPDGALQWQRWFANQFVAGSIADLAIDGDGHTYAAGELVGNATLVAYSPSGDVDWTREGDDAAYLALTRDASGDLWALRDDGAVDRYTEGGMIVWTSSDEVTPVDATLAADSAGNVFALGRPEGGGYDYVLLSQLDEDGVKAWTEVYDSPGTTIDPGGLEALPNYGALMIATRLQDDAGAGLLVWFDADGQPIVEQLIEPEPDTAVWMLDVAVAPSQDYAVAVGVNFTDEWSYRLRIVKFVL